MSRATNAPASRTRRRRRLKQARGFYGARHRLFRMATESVDNAMKAATVHRKDRKREFRSLWIVRLSAACKLNKIGYNRLIEGLTKAGVELNRKMLSEIAIHDPKGFGSIVELARTKLA